MSQDKDNNEAASASQSSTPVPRVGGPDEAKTIDTLDFAKVLGVLLRADRKRIKAGALADPEWMTAYEAFVAYIDSHIAHVARQRQESAPYWTAEEIANACVKAGLGILECNSLIVTLKSSTPSAAAAQDVDTAEMVPVIIGGKFYYTAEMMTTNGAQQREAGRWEGFDKGWDEGHIAGREKGRSRQPAGEGLTSMTRYEPCAAYGGPVMKADAQGEWVSYADVQALSAVPPAKAEGMSDEQIKSEYAQQLKKCYASGRPHEPIADVIVSTVRAILAQQAKGGGSNV